jgi:integrase
LEAWLRLNPGAGAVADGPVFPTLCTKRKNGWSGLSATFSRFVSKAGIDGGLIREGKGEFGKNVSALTFHSLRHSFTSALANAGVSQEHRMLLTGHRSVSIHDTYSHHKLESLREAIATLPRLG